MMTDNHGKVSQGGHGFAEVLISLFRAAGTW
jgi:hypothetical protein